MKTEMKNEIRVNGNRLRNALMAMAEIGHRSERQEQSALSKQICQATMPEK